MGAPPFPDPGVVRGLPLPTVGQAQELARDLLGDQGTRLAHVRTAGAVAGRLAILFAPADAQLLVVAATLHDIGYSPRIARTGFHPLDGALFLVAEGYPQRLASLVAHHSLAAMTADAHGIRDLEERFPRPQGLLADSLAYADMHSAPDGRVVPVEHRLADIGSRHDDPAEQVRARQLRLAIARIGSALLAAYEAAGGLPEHAVARGRPRPGGDVEGATFAARFAMSLPAGDLQPSSQQPDLRDAFESWWSAELRYTREVEVYEYAARASGGMHRAALRLARIRSRADARRDRYFRRALA
jgi:hypothetical protein